MINNKIYFIISEWSTEHISDMAMLLSKCENVFSADVPMALQVRLLYYVHSAMVTLVWEVKVGGPQEGGQP